MRIPAAILVLAACGASEPSGNSGGTGGSDASSSADVSTGSSESSGGVPSLPCELPATEGWTVERVAEAAHWSTGLSGTEWTIAARDGVRGIVYRSENRLVYAQHNGTQWISDDVAGIGIEQFIHPPALALDEGGQPIIALGQKDPFGSTAI
jgi:hypothetical protein